MDNNTSPSAVFVVLLILSWASNVFLLIYRELNSVVAVMGSLIFVFYVVIGKKSAATRDWGQIYGWNKKPPTVKSLMDWYPTRRFESIMSCWISTALFILPLLRILLQKLTDNQKVIYMTTFFLFFIISFIAHWIIFDPICEQEYKIYKDFEKKFDKN